VVLLKRKKLVREKKKRKIRGTVSGSAKRPRLSVFKSAKNIYVQAIDDSGQRTLASASSKDKAFAGKNGGNCDAAKLVGQIIAERLLASNVKNAVFDRNGFVYHGRIKALAEGAREGGLLF